LTPNAPHSTKNAANPDRIQRGDIFVTSLLRPGEGSLPHRLSSGLIKRALTVAPL